MSILTPASGFAVDLTEAYLLGTGNTPCVAGDDLRLRFQVRKDGVAVDLTGATAWWTMQNKIGGATSFVRKSSTGQIVFDDQTSEDEDLGTGTGWLTVIFLAADQATLLAFVGLLRPWDLRLRLAAPGSEVETHGRGRIEWLRPRTTSLT